MHRSDLRHPLLPPLLLIINPSQLLPFGLSIRPHAVTAKVNEGKKAERLEEIELRFLFIWGGEGCFYLLWNPDGYKKRTRH